MRFSIDEDPPEVLSADLRQRGHDAINAREAGTKGLRDPQQLALAMQEGRVFVTCNRRDFMMLHEAWMICWRAWGTASGVAHPGILIIPNGSEMQQDDMARIIEEFAQTVGTAENRLFRWTPTGGWREVVDRH